MRPRMQVGAVIVYNNAERKMSAQIERREDHYAVSVSVRGYETLGWLYKTQKEADAALDLAIHFIQAVYPEKVTP